MAALYLFIFFTCFVQIAFFLFIYTKYLRLETDMPLHDAGALQPVSVVICARNEAENIKNYLPVVMQQAYPEYEVIVIDDGSTDGTREILAEYEGRYDNLLSFRIEPHEKVHGGKKQAVSHGVSLAKYEWIVVTDADCCPAGNMWLAHMASAMSDDKDIVLGVSPYFSEGGGWRNFFRVETMFIAIQYISFLLAGLPFMGVGRNMAFRKKVFDNHDIRAHWDLLSGDDDLFINEAASGGNIGVCAGRDAFTFSKGPSSWREWFRQKRRHYTTGYRYNLMQKIWLGYYWLTSLLLYLLIPATVLFYMNDLSQAAFPLAILMITACIRWTILARALKKMGAQNISLSVPIFDFAYILSVWIISPLSGLGKSRWS